MPVRSSNVFPMAALADRFLTTTPEKGIINEQITARIIRWPTNKDRQLDKYSNSLTQPP